MIRRRPRILVRGAGLAGLTAAKLLRDRGVDIRMAAAPRARGRIVAIPIETLRLAAELHDLDVAALATGPMVERRAVDWSAGGAAVMPQAAVICDVADLAARLARRLDESARAPDAADTEVDWTLDAAGQAADEALRAGERVGQFVRLATASMDATTMTVAATAAGWFFAAPHPDGGRALLLVSPSAAASVATADQVAERVAGSTLRAAAGDVVAIGRPAPIAPSLARSLHAPACLRIGDAALALDPLRGDGAGFALRGALLAQAVLAAIERGEDRERCVGHYARRMRAVFAGHLRGCIAHYRAARHAAVWRRDIAAMAALAGRMPGEADAFDFRLAGRDLAALDATNPNA